MARRYHSIVATVAIVSIAGIANAALFTPGNLAIYRYGVASDGSTPSTQVAEPVFIDEYSPTGTLVQSIAIPTTTVGANRRLTTQGNANIEGLLNRSTDGQYLLLTGYDLAPGDGSGTAPAMTNASAVNRVIGRVDFAGNVDTTTALNDTGVGSPRAAISDDGNNLWMSFNGAGARYATVGATTSTQLNATQGDIRHIDIFGGQLYGSSSSSTTGTFAIGTGLPTTSGQTIFNMTGVVSGAGTNTGTSGTGAGTVQFFLADLDTGVAGMDTLYVVGDGNGAAMRKYSFVGGTWTSNGQIGDSADTDTVNDENYRGLTGMVIGSTVSLYAIRHGVSNNLDELVTVTDSSGYNGAFTGTPTFLASALTNTKWQGLDFVPVAIPEASSVALFGLVSILTGLVSLYRRSQMAGKK